MHGIEEGLTEFITWCDYLGTFAFAISGIRLAAALRFDWFGAYVVGVVTAVGGGTVRDILLNVPPFWMLQPSYLFISMLALIFTIVFRKYVVRLNHTVFIFDTVGIGLFTIVGVAKTFECGYAWWLAIAMGTITGSFGGMIRDILINQTPLIFRKDIYAMACLIGGAVYVGLMYTTLPIEIIQFIAAFIVVAVRFVSVKYHISIPAFRGAV
ncbi:MULTISPECIES: trimeric intracellular cation channel family protein [Porphyromonas]|uniref:Membrane protein n=1 Tax=Porphyromonas gulae TaxID=111105 RepID=A0A0A2F3N3_9PORP|nr:MULTISPECIES: trimeric intracellular cation channel family protein [Porphyromonas]KGL55117.1 membrane protein [Porphyromonas sp. COT-052 OH4946]KGN85618.1 membrane protein [Porphyromonas gulae]KGN88445.1 membrane protein [Porphyromonas gulae]